MALPAALQALFDRLQTYNSDAYNASTNPGGFARGGNQKPVDNFIKSVRDFTAFGKGISDLASQAGADAQATAADRVQTGQDRTAAAASATNAAGSASTAKADADRAVGAAAGVNLPALVAGDELKFLQVKQDRSGYQTALIQKATSAQLLAGTDDSAFLTPLTAQALWSRPRITRTANTALTKANRQSLIDITSGTFTQTFAAAATLGDGWETMIRNSGAGDITLDPNGSETIDGTTTLVIPAGQTRLVLCSGSAFFTLPIVSPSKFESALLHVRDERAAGSDGGAATAGAWNTRVLNTIRTNEIGASIASNLVTLPAGTYYVEASAPAFKPINHQLRLANTTDNTVLLLGTSEYADNSDNVQARAFITGRFSIAAQKQVSLQSFVSNAVSSFDFGRSSSSAAAAVFSDMRIWKVS